MLWCTAKSRVTDINPLCHPVLVILTFFRWVSFARLRSRLELISVKLLISLISRHAAKRLDLTGQAWASTETTDLQAKLWIGNVPKPGAACWMESSCMMIPAARLQEIPHSLLTSPPATLHFNPTFTVLLRDVVVGRSFTERGINFLTARFQLLTYLTLYPGGALPASHEVWPVGLSCSKRMNHIPYEA